MSTFCSRMWRTVDGEKRERVLRGCKVSDGSKRWGVKGRGGGKVEGRKSVCFRVIDDADGMGVWLGVGLNERGWLEGY